MDGNKGEFETELCLLQEQHGIGIDGGAFEREMVAEWMGNSL
jgi:hypothetical protein